MDEIGNGNRFVAMKTPSEMRAKIKELTAARSAAAAEQARSAERKAMLSTYVKGMLAPLTSAGGVAPPSAGSSLAKVEELLGQSRKIGTGEQYIRSTRPYMLAQTKVNQGGH